MLDIFHSDAFSVTSLTDAINEIAITSTRLGDMGLFTDSSVNTLTVGIERVGQVLQIVSPSPRGAPGETRDEQKRSLDALAIPHFQRDWSVMADEVSGVRAFGQETTLETVQGKVAEKLADNAADLDATDELARLGAVQGIITYKDGTSLNLFQKFGVVQAAEVDFDLDNVAPVDGILRRRCTAIIRQTRSVLRGVPFSYVHALVGDNFFDDLLQNKEVRDTYKGWSEAQILRDSYVGNTRAENPIFQFGGIVFENYGAVDQVGDGPLLGIASDKAKFFPVGARGLFRCYYAPADYIETVNTNGLRRYAKQWDMQNGKGIMGESQTNALHICTRPATLLSAKRT